MHKRIMSVNINDLGGKTQHLMNHRYFNNRDRRSHIDWEYWATHIDKTKVWEGLKRYIERKNPDLLILEEMLISCYERIDFIAELEEMGYNFVEESLPERGNYSLTMTFYKGKTPTYINSPGDYRSNRSVICEDDDMLICGSHFPSESDEEFLGHMKAFMNGNMDKDLLLIGDLNANDPSRGNKIMVNSLIEEGAVDLWIAAGGKEDTPTEAQYSGRLDYAISSPSLAKKVEKIEIDSYPMDANLTDHAAIIIDIVN